MARLRSSASAVSTRVRGAESAPSLVVAFGVVVFEAVRGGEIELARFDAQHGGDGRHIVFFARPAGQRVVDVHGAGGGVGQDGAGVGGLGGLQIVREEELGEHAGVVIGERPGGVAGGDGGAQRGQITRAGSAVGHSAARRNQQRYEKNRQSPSRHKRNW